MPSESTEQLLANYHDASQRLQAIWESRLPTDEAKELYNQLTKANRELISRCILNDDPRGFVFLIEEMVIVLKILGQPTAANYLDIAVQHLIRCYEQFGSF